MQVNRKLVGWSRAVHVYLSIVLLIVLVFFAITGITLNNAALLSGEPEVTTTVIDTLPQLPRDEENQITSSPELKAYMQKEFGINLKHASVVYEDEFLIIDYQAPGKATLIEIDQGINEVFVEETHFGLIAILNDLHKGRHVDIIINWLIDISAGILILFSLAGFILLLPNKRRFKKVFTYTSLCLAILSLGYYMGSVI